MLAAVLAALLARLRGMDAGRFIDTTATLHCDGFLKVDTFARNTWAFAGFKPRIQIMAFDAEDNTWLSPVWAFPISLCATTDPTCDKERAYSFSDVKVPEDFAKRVVRLEIFHAHDRNPV